MQMNNSRSTQTIKLVTSKCYGIFIFPHLLLIISFIIHLQLQFGLLFFVYLPQQIDSGG